MIYVIFWLLIVWSIFAIWFIGRFNQNVWVIYYTYKTGFGIANSWGTIKASSFFVTLKEIRELQEIAEQKDGVYDNSFVIKNMIRLSK